MKQFANLVASGLVTGAIYSIMASGLVLTYTTSGIFNFAHGAVAFATAYVFYQLHAGLDVPIVVALIVSVFVFAPLLGLLLNRILLRRLSNAPVYARIVGTIGLLIALPALVQWLVVTVGIGALDWDLAGNRETSEGIPVAGIGPTPRHNYRLPSGVVVNSDQLAVLIVAALAAFVLWFVIRRTRLGLEMRAVVDRETLAGLRGVNAARTSAAAWVMTMILAGLGGVLIAPLFTLEDQVFTLVVLGSLAAVVLGKMRSIPIAFAGGLALGVVQNLVAGYSDRILPDNLSRLSGLKSSVPFLLVIVLLGVFGAERSRRAGSIAEEAPRPDHRTGMSALRRRVPWAIFIVTLIAYAMQWFTPSWARADAYYQSVIAQSLAYGIIFLSFVVVTGMGGMVSLAQATFVVAGGFATGWALDRDWGIDFPLIATDGELNFFWAIVIGVLAAALVGALLALVMTNLGDFNLALGTLAFAFFCSLVPFATKSIRHGEGGWSIRAPSLDVPGLNWINGVIRTGNPRLVFDQGAIEFREIESLVLLYLVVFGLVTLMIHALYRSASGRAILAVRSSAVAAEASAVHVNRYKVMVFALGAGIAGLGATMLGIYNGAATSSTAPPIVGLMWLALAVTFGIRRPGGALLAGFAFAGGTPLLHLLADTLPGGTVNDLVTSTYFLPILSGLGAIQLAQEPDGILALTGQQRLARRRKRQRVEQRVDHVDDRTVDLVGESPVRERAVVDGAVPTATTPDAALSLRGIVAGYGDVEVLHGIDLDVRRGEVVALLGANGAGKSTLCAVAGGLVDATGGAVLMDGRDVTRRQAWERARDGLVLVPEARGIFPGLTVDENLSVLLADAELRERAYARFPALTERRHLHAGLLSGGQQQMLSLAAAFAKPPAVLIADEPTLGLAPSVATIIIDAILELRDLGTAVLMVEEQAQNALRAADTICLMSLGAITWSGPRGETDLDHLAGAYLGAHV